MPHEATSLAVLLPLMGNTNLEKWLENCLYSLEKFIRPISLPANVAENLESHLSLSLILTSPPTHLKVDLQASKAL